MNVFRRVTLRTLQKNRSRTLVTLIGVLLSAAMLTAVTSSIASLQDYLRRCNVYLEGDWHVSFDAVPAEDLPRLRDDPLVEAMACARELGYAAADSRSEDKPYVYVLGADEAFFSRMPVHLTEGRLPETGGELLLPDHLRAYGSEWAVGDTLTLDLGRRRQDGETLGQHTPCLPGETLEIQDRRTYTVTGFYERPGFENYTAPGYTALTCWEDGAEPLSVYFRLTDPQAAFAFAAGEPVDGQAHYRGPGGGTVNTTLLLSEGASRYDSFYRMLWGLGAVLMGIIVFGAVALIYNAFSISVSERTQQFGLLCSVGATRRQLRQMVWTEAWAVSLLGIPLGIGAGLAGIGVTLSLLGGRFSALYGVEAVPMRLRVSPAALLLAAGVALGTVLVSAWIPTRRATRVTAMEAIRQHGDVAVRGRDVRAPRLLYRLFGLEGLLAAKYFRRSRRRYRATVLSLFMSVVLFLSASSFCAYLGEAVSGTLSGCDYDLSYTWQPAPGRAADEAARRRAALSGTEGVTQTSAVLEYSCSWQVPLSQLPAETARRLRDDGAGETYEGNCFFRGVDEKTYRSYLLAEGLDPAVFLDTDRPKAVALAQSRVFRPDRGRMETLALLDGDADSVTVALGDEAEREETFAVGAVVDRLPFGLNDTEYYGLYLVYPMEYLEALLGDDVQARLYFAADDHAAVLRRLERAPETRDGSVYDSRADDESQRNMVLILRVFTYGFIVLISLIAAANVFHTVSTNLMLRRREFAVLESVGMTRRGFLRMMNYECLLYGAKALLYGLPAAFAVTYLIFRAVRAGYDTAFHVPLSAVAAAVGSVFLVVFLSMLYGMRKRRRDTVAEALRNENL